MKNKFKFFLSWLLLAIILINPVIKAGNERLIIDLTGNNEFQLEALHYINYTIQPGDTLYKLALRFGTSVGELMALNNIDSYLIYPGQLSGYPFH